MKQTYPSWLTRGLARPLAALGLLLATTGAAQAQTPTATFAPVARYAAGTGPLGMQLADVTQDGFTDVVAVNFASNNVSVLPGSASGVLGTAANFGCGNGPLGLALADLNGDGKLDAVTANYYDGQIGVLLGGAAGSFGAPTAFACGSAPYDVVLGDVNGDGKLDAVTANSGSNTAGVLLGTGTGSFRPAVQVPAGTFPNGVALSDVSGDGNLDIVVTNDGGGISVMLGTGSGSFGAATAYGTSLGGARNLAIGDFNRDSRPDVVVSVLSGPVGVLLGTGAGTFGAATTYPAGGTNSTGVAVADLNGDGWLDVAAADVRTGTMGVLLGTGTGTFAPVTSYNTGDNSSQDVAIGDLNNDSKPDIVVGEGSNGSGYRFIKVFLNTTAFAAPTLTSLNPTSGPVGRSITLTGTNLGGATGVSFNGTAATTFAVVNATTVTATVPTGATTGNVTVTTPGGTSGGVLFTVAAPTITLAPSTLPGSQVGVQYPTISLSATGGTSPYTFAITSGALPAGLTLGTGGSLSGTPTAGGPFSFTVTATDAAGFPGSRAYTLTITPPSIRVVPTSLATGDVGRAYSQLLEAINGTAPYTFAITSGALPAGLTLSAGGLLAGTPTAGGTFTFTVTATDASTGAGPYTGAQTYSLGIAPARLTLNPTSLPDGTVGTAYSQTVTAAGGISPYTYALTSGTLPTGLVLSAGGVLAGTPTAGSFFVFTITARDASTGVGPASTSQTYAVTIDAGPIDLVVTTTTTIAAGTYNSITVNSPGVGTLAGNVTVNSAVTVNSGATLNDGCFVLSGAGSFTLAAGGTLGICNAAGISSSGATGAVQVTGARSFSTDASYVYNGTAPQSTGNGLPAQVRNLSTTNASSVTLTSPTSATQIITVGGAGNLVLNGNALTLLSSAAGTALVVNSGTGVVSGNTAVVQRYIDGSLNSGLGYRHYASPMQYTTVADLTTAGFTPVVNSAYNTSPTPSTVTPFPTVYGYNQGRLASTTNNLPAFDKGYVSPATLSDALNPGQGYTVHIGANQVVDFVGTLTNTEGFVVLNRNSGATAADAGWALLGNPYPAPLNYALVDPGDRPGLDAAIYVYQSTGQYVGRYRSYVNSIGNPVLPVAQGFFARVSAGQTSGVLFFRKSQRLTTVDGTSFQRTTADLRPQVQLELRPGTSLAAADEFTAYAETGATAPFDSQYDAVKVPNPTGFNLASVAASGEPLAIDGRAAFTAAIVLPLTVGVPAAGTYVLSAAALNNLPAGLDAYLADDLTGQTTKLSAGTSYSFSVSAAQATATITGRFRLLFRPATALATTAASLSAADVTVFPNPAHERFTLVLPGLAQASTVQAELLNTLGQVVRRQSANLPATGTQLSFDTAGLATGVYTLRLQAGPTTLAKRVVIE